MFERNNCPNDSAKLHWETKHVPLSVSVCSNISGFDQLKCFISNGDPRQLVQDIVKYLVEITKESYCLLKQDFATLFEAIKSWDPMTKTNNTPVKRKIMMTKEKVKRGRGRRNRVRN